MPCIPIAGGKTESMKGYPKNHHLSIVATGQDPGNQNPVPGGRWLHRLHLLQLTCSKLYPTSHSGMASFWDQVAFLGIWDIGSP